MVNMKCTHVFRGAFSNWGGGGSGDGVTWEDLSMEEFFLKEENIHEGGAGFSSIIKNNQLEVMSSFKT